MIKRVNVSVDFLGHVNIKIEEAEKEIHEMAKKYNMAEEDIKNSLGGIDALIYDIKVRKAIDLMKGTTEKEITGKNK